MANPSNDSNGLECSACKQTLTPEHFSKNQRRKANAGKDPRCKECLVRIQEEATEWKSGGNAKRMKKENAKRKTPDSQNNKQEPNENPKKQKVDPKPMLPSPQQTPSSQPEVFDSDSEGSGYIGRKRSRPKNYQPLEHLYESDEADHEHEMKAPTPPPPQLTEEIAFTRDELIFQSRFEMLDNDVFQAVCGAGVGDTCLMLAQMLNEIDKDNIIAMLSISPSWFFDKVAKLCAKHVDADVTCCSDDEGNVEQEGDVTMDGADNAPKDDTEGKSMEGEEKSNSIKREKSSDEKELETDVVNFLTNYEIQRAVPVVMERFLELLKKEPRNIELYNVLSDAASLRQIIAGHALLKFCKSSEFIQESFPSIVQYLLQIDVTVACAALPQILLALPKIVYDTNFKIDAVKILSAFDKNFSARKYKVAEDLSDCHWDVLKEVAGDILFGKANLLSSEELAIMATKAGCLFELHERLAKRGHIHSETVSADEDNVDTTATVMEDEDDELNTSDDEFIAKSDEEIVYMSDEVEEEILDSNDETSGDDSEEYFQAAVQEKKMEKMKKMKRTGDEGAIEPVADVTDQTETVTTGEVSESVVDATDQTEGSTATPEAPDTAGEVSEPIADKAGELADSDTGTAGDQQEGSETSKAQEKDSSVNEDSPVSPNQAVSDDKAMSADKAMSTDKAVSADKVVSADKAVSADQNVGADANVEDDDDDNLGVSRM